MSPELLELVAPLTGLVAPSTGLPAPSAGPGTAAASAIPRAPRGEDLPA
ncbi:hypothetical protein ROT00_15395 [Agromyces mediolanus]